ncbi:hypothetical protein PTKIN_Ptkin13bG0206200 [Pterospermum kingtungense]
MPVLKKTIQQIKMIVGKIDLKKVFAPTAIAAIVGFIIATVSPIRKLLIGDSSPLHVIDTSAYFLGEAAIPCLTLILGANLLRGLNGSEASRFVIIGILAVRNIVLPLLGICVVKAAHHFGMVGSDSLYQFVLMLQYAVPPATAVVLRARSGVAVVFPNCPSGCPIPAARSLVNLGLLFTVK